jgi:transposase
MGIVGGLDIHRRQITFDYLDARSGETRHGRIAPADRMLLRSWLEATARRRGHDGGVRGRGVYRLAGSWSRSCSAPGRGACGRAGRHLRRARPEASGEDHWADARLLRDLLAEGRLPESWIPPAQVLEMRARLQLFRDLREQHTVWVQRIHAILLPHGVPAVAGCLLGLDNRRRLEAGMGLSLAGREAVAAALRILDALDAELEPLRKQITAFAARQPGCRALQADYGIGPITATALWTELGRSRRFSASRKAVRHTGLDITVHSSDGKRPPGHLSRQGSPLLRWALFEAAQCAARPGSPDDAYYRQVADRVGGTRAALSVARKMVRRAHHTLRALGDQALAPV